MKPKTLRTLAAILFLSAAGCASIEEGCVNTEMKIRNHILAQKAWGEWSWCYDDLDYPMHFAKGFKDGYRDILDGGTGCQPTLPPKCYWKPQYQSAEGGCKTNAWFDGFSHGALAAQQDGFGSLNQIPISPTARTNLMTLHTRPRQSVYGHAQMPPLPDSVPGNPGQAAVDADGNIIDGLPPANAIPNRFPVPVKPYEE